MEGLDGTYRISDIGGNGTLPDHNPAAVKGDWISDDMIGHRDGIEYIGKAELFGKDAATRKTGRLRSPQIYA